MSSEPGTSTWADVALKYGLSAKLANHPGMLIYGETYGNNSDMSYGVERQKEGDRFAAFDVYDTNKGEWLSYDEFRDFCEDLDIPVAPIMRSGFWNEQTYEDLSKLAEGKTTLPGADHVREGFVIRPVNERLDPRFGRVILKMAGEGYHTRNEAKPKPKTAPQAKCA